MDEAQGSTATTDGPPKRGPGRPRRPGTEERAYKAALELFGQVGWSSLSLDAVAQRAGIGKSSIYLRWKDKRDLLVDAVRDLEATHVNPPLELPIRDYLIAHARARAELVLGEQGPLIASGISAAMANPEDYAEVMDESLNRGAFALATRIERAVEEGELPPSTSASHLLDAIEGAIYFHFLISNAGKPRVHLRAGLDEYVTELVDMVLAGVMR